MVDVSKSLVLLPPNFLPVLPVLLAIGVQYFCFFNFFIREPRHCVAPEPLLFFVNQEKWDDICV